MIANEPKMTVEQHEAITLDATKRFAATHRLRVRRDECGDPIIPGRLGHLWFDDDELCLMALDRRPANISRWEALEGKVWLGDISPNEHGVRVQDANGGGLAGIKGLHRS